MTHPPFFPLNTLDQIMDRKALVLAEFKTFLSDDTSVLQIMHLSEVAYQQREARRKAVESGKIFHG